MLKERKNKKKEEKKRMKRERREKNVGQEFIVSNGRTNVTE